MRDRWPGVEILFRADSGFCRDWLMTWCEQNGVDYLIGLARNSRLETEMEADILGPWRPTEKRRKSPVPLVDLSNCATEP